MPRGAQVSVEKYERVRPLLAEGLSDLEIARRTGIHRNTVARYRTGKSVPASLGPRPAPSAEELMLRRAAGELDLLLRQPPPPPPPSKGGRPVSLPKYKAAMQLVEVGLSNAEIAAQVGLHRNTILRYRTGQIVAPTVAPPVPSARWPTRRHRYRPPEDMEGLDRWADDGGRLVPQRPKPGPKYLRPTGGLFGQEKYKTARSRGLCVACEGPAPPNQSRCGPCLLYALIKTYAKALRRMQAGQCAACGAAVGDKGAWRCTACLAKRRGRIDGGRRPAPASALPSLDALIGRVTALGAEAAPDNVQAVRRVMRALQALLALGEKAAVCPKENRR